jgi:FdhE protein
MLEALADAAKTDERLSTYYTFQRTLLQELDKAKANLSASLELADEEALQARLAQGLPLVGFAQLPIEERAFAKLVTKIAEILLEYDPDLTSAALPETPSACYALAKQRFEENQANTGSDGDQAQPSLAQTAVDLALRPYLEWAAEQTIRYVDQESWKRDYCPVCAGAPDFAALQTETGARHLLCSRCNSEWLYPRVKCPFCGNADHAKLYYFPSDDQVYRLYVCKACNRYLKTIDLREVERGVLLPVERITTVAMDAAARGEGYT